MKTKYIRNLSEHEAKEKLQADASQYIVIPDPGKNSQYKIFFKDGKGMIASEDLTIDDKGHPCRTKGRITRYLNIQFLINHILLEHSLPPLSNDDVVMVPPSFDTYIKEKAIAREKNTRNKSHYILFHKDEQGGIFACDRNGPLKTKEGNIITGITFRFDGSIDYNFERNNIPYVKSAESIDDFLTHAITIERCKHIHYDVFNTEDKELKAQLTHASNVDLVRKYNSKLLYDVVSAAQLDFKGYDIKQQEGKIIISKDSCDLLSISPSDGLQMLAGEENAKQAQEAIAEVADVCVRCSEVLLKKSITDFHASHSKNAIDSQSVLTQKLDNFPFLYNNGQIGELDKLLPKVLADCYMLKATHPELRSKQRKEITSTFMAVLDRFPKARKEILEQAHRELILEKRGLTNDRLEHREKETKEEAKRYNHLKNLPNSFDVFEKQFNKLYNSNTASKSKSYKSQWSQFKNQAQSLITGKSKKVEEVDEAQISIGKRM